MNVELRINEYIHELCKKVQYALDHNMKPDTSMHDYLKEHGVDSLPEIRSETINKWTKYGWVPLLPSFRGEEIIKMLVPPCSAEEADNIMIQKLDDNELNLLFKELQKYILKNNYNNSTFSESIVAFRNELYSGCALLIYALIDACFINAQTIPLKGRRDLAEKAAKNKIERIDSYFLSCANISINIVKELFKNADDFKGENGMNRNYLSHGMNQYIPNKIDCLKLFVLLYGVYALFDTKVLVLKK